MRELDQLEGLLQRLDEGEPRDRPTTFDYDSVSARFHEVRRALEAEFRTDLRFETGAKIQDAAFHSYVALPSPLGPASVRFSNFGDLTSIWSDEKTVPPEILVRAIGVLERHGYVYVPFSLLERPFTQDDPNIRDWWTRFFDYV
jgi:hypothetical protein